MACGTDDRTKDAARRGLARGWLVALLVVALVPRVALFCTRSTICSDAVFYIERARALARGNVAAGLDEIGVNLYTLLLAAAAQAGFDPCAIGRLISLAASSLTVVPLAAFTSAVFGRRAGLIAGLLYALAAEPLDWSVEAIRDPLFWLIFVAGLWAAWRAATEARLRDHLAWGLCFASAAMLRSEGLLLLLPALAWSIAWRRRAGWLAALGRIAAGVALFPALLVSVNLALAGLGHDRFEWGRLDHLRIITASIVGADTRPTPTVRAPTAPVPPQASLTFREIAWGVRHNIVEGLGWPVMALAAIGCGIAVRRLFAKKSGADSPSADGATELLASVVLVVLAAALVAAMWIYLRQMHELSVRYTVSLLLVSLPLAAFGADRLLDALDPSRFPLGVRRFGTAAAWLALVALGVSGTADGLSRGNDSRAMKADLGRHLENRFGTGRRLMASDNLERLVGYYAHAEHTKLPREVGGPTVLDFLRKRQPEIVLLWTRAQPGRYAEVLETRSCLGYVRQPLPPRFAGVELLVHRRLLDGEADRLARREVGQRR